MDDFDDDFRCFNGLTFITDKGRLKTFRTLAHNKPGHFIKDVSSLDLAGYDLVLSDFEPVTAWAARLKGKPSIGISHQCAFDYGVPKVSGHLSSRALMKVFAPTQIRIGLHWHHFGQPVLPPLIEPQTAKPAIDNKVVVYMGFEQLDDIVRFLKPFSDWQFIVYAKVSDTRQLGHIRVQPLSHHDFHEDLADCSGVISNAGFELASECLHLGKKLLVKPLLGQFEQLSNACGLEVLERGRVMHSLDQKILQQWLEEPAREPMNYPDVATTLADWIKQGHLHDQRPLLEQLWPDRLLPA